MKRRMTVELLDNGKKVKVMGVDSNGAPYHLFKKVSIKAGTQNTSFPNTKVARQPYQQTLPDGFDATKTLEITCEFQGHYHEPNLTFSVDMADLIEHGKVEYEMVFGAGDTGNWEIIVKKGSGREVFGVVEDFKQTAPTASTASSTTASTTTSSRSAAAGAAAGAAARPGVRRVSASRIANNNKAVGAK